MTKKGHKGAKGGAREKYFLVEGILDDHWSHVT